MVKRITPPPVKSRMDLRGLAKGISEPWRKWFNLVDYDTGNKIDLVSGGTAGNIAILTAAGGVDDGGISLSKYKSITYSISTALTVGDLGKVIKVDNGTNAATITLPSVTSTSVDSWIRIIRLGSGSLTIKAADSDTIESSLPGGRARCDEGSERVVANLSLFLATETKWAIMAGTGTWKIF